MLYRKNQLGHYRKTAKAVMKFSRLIFPEPFVILTRSLFAIALALMFITAVLLNPQSERVNLSLAQATFVLASGFLLVALRFAPSLQVTDDQGFFRSPIYAIRWELFGIGLALILLLVQINVLARREDLSWWLEQFAGVHYHLQIALFVVGLAFVTGGLSGERDITKHFIAYLRYWRNLFHWKPHHFLLAIIMIIAVISRVWNLEHAIEYLVDEIHYIDGIRILRTRDVYILTQFSGLTAFSWLYPYMQSLVVSLTGPNLFAVRIISAGFGIAEVFALYHLGTILFHRRFGLTSALILATFPVHMHFSRIGLANIADPLFAILTFYFLVYGFRSQRALHFALAGLCLGLTSYFYEAGRLLFLPFTFCWLIWLGLFCKSHCQIRSVFRRNWMIFLVSLMLVILPLYFTWFANGLQAFPRLAQTQSTFPYWQDIFNRTGNIVATIVNGLTDTFLTLVYKLDTSQFYTAHSALILPEIVPFFLLGFVVSFYRFRRLDGSLLFWWVIAVIFGNTFMENRYHSARYVLLYPVLVMHITLGIEIIVCFLFQHRPRQNQNLIIMMLVIGIGIFQLNYYFGTHLPNYYQWSKYHLYTTDGKLAEDLDDIFLRAVTLPDNTIVHIVTRAHLCECVFYIFAEYYDRYGEIDFEYADPDDLTSSYLENLDPTRNHAFFFNQADRDSISRLRRHYEIGQPQFSFLNFPHEKQAEMYFISVSNMQP